MSAHVFNFLNELRKRDKIQGLSNIYLFCNEFNKLNNTGARMLDSIYTWHLFLKNRVFDLKRQYFIIFYAA